MSITSFYFGTTPKSVSCGIFLMHFDSDTGIASDSQLVASQAGAAFLAESRDGKFLYAVDSGFIQNGEKISGISAYVIDAKTRQLTHLNFAQMDGVPCHISLDKTGKWLLGAAYTQGVFSIWPINADGSIGAVHRTIKHAGNSVEPRRQAAPHPHQIITSPDNQYICVADLGIDKIMIYPFDATSGELASDEPTFAQLAPGAGPRHLAFHPSGDSFFVVNELDNTVTAFKKEGEYAAIQSLSTLPNGYSQPTWTAEIIISSNGQFIYITNRGHDSIASFKVNPDRTLTLLDITPTGEFPQHITFSPDEKWLLCADQNDNAIRIFSINTVTGALLQNTVIEDLPGAPMCIQFANA